MIDPTSPLGDTLRALIEKIRKTYPAQEAHKQSADDYWAGQCSSANRLADDLAALVRAVPLGAAQQERIRELEILIAAKEATIMAVVHAVGGTVEGRPTHRGNFLQRIRQLLATEEQNHEARKSEDQW